MPRPSLRGETLRVRRSPALGLLLGCLSTLFAAGSASFAAGSAGEVISGEPIFGGCLIRDGEYVPPPYVVSSQGKSLLLNGRPLGGIRGKGLRDARDGGMPHISTEAAEEPVANSVWLDPQAAAVLEASFARGRIERRLTHGGLFVQTEEGASIEFDVASGQAILSLLCSPQSRTEKIRTLLQRDDQGLDSRQWGLIVDRFVPTDELRRQIADYDRQSSICPEGIEIVRGTGSRGPLYALTVAGMVLVVLAFGTILSTKPEAADGWRHVDNSDSSIQLVVKCLLVMAVLSGFDLLCTVWTDSTGRFQEINPLAAGIIGSTAALIVFKVALTGLATGILWRLRRFRGAQLASWWICLLLTMLTVRWVVVESLLLA